MVTTLEVVVPVEEMTIMADQIQTLDLVVLVEMVVADTELGQEVEHIQEDQPMQLQ
jgi:hypothetical protein